MSSLAILVLSCDKYKSIWDPFFQNFRKKWPDCPFQVYLLTNQLNYDNYGVSPIRVGEDISWGSNLINALNELNESHVLTIFDDLLFERKIDTERIKKLFSRVVSDDIEYLQLNYAISHNPQNIDKDKIGLVAPHTAYRSSAVMTIWRKDVLLDITSKDDTPWTFEIYGAERTNKYLKWYSCKDENMPYLNLIIKGKYEPGAMKKAMKDGIQFPRSIDVMNVWETLHYHFLLVRTKVFSTIVPVGMRSQIRNRIWKKR